MIPALTVMPDVTRLLNAWQTGDATAMRQVWPLVYDELRRIAHDRLSRVPAGQTLSTCALVHESYERIAGAGLALNDRRHFLALMSRVMRNVLVDRAVANGAQRRGDGQVHLSLDAALEVGATSAALDPELLDLHDAMVRLGALDARKEQIVELSFFGGLTRPEIAEVLAVSRATVDRELRMATAWLKSRLHGDPANVD